MSSFECSTLNRPYVTSDHHGETSKYMVLRPLASLSCVYVCGLSLTDGNIERCPVLGNSCPWLYPPHCTEEGESLVIPMTVQPTVARPGQFGAL